MTINLDELTELQEQAKENSHGLKNMNDEALRRTLKAVRDDELNSLKEAWQEKGARGKEPCSLSPLRVASLLSQFVTFRKLGVNGYTNLGMYQAERGIYTLERDDMVRVVSWLEPTLDKRQTDETLFHIEKGLYPTALSKDHNLVPVKNGIFNRKEKKLEPFSHEHIFLSRIDTLYKEEGTSPIIEVDGVKFDFDQWLKELANDDEEVIELFWQIFSDVCSPNYNRRQSIWLYGAKGSNGKGTFQSVITNMVGKDNVANLKVEEFDKPFAISQLLGKTCCIGDDCNPHHYVDNSSNYKSAVTGDPLLFEIKHKPSFSDSYNGTMIMSMNGFPKFKENNGGLDRRLLIVPFNREFKGEGDNWKIKDVYLKDKRILEYILAKALLMDFEKFISPKVTVGMLNQFKQENDNVFDYFIEDFNELKSARLPIILMYEHYKYLANQKGLKPVSRPKFTQRFKEISESDGWNYKVSKVGIFLLDDDVTLIESMVNYDLGIHEMKRKNKSGNTFTNSERESQRLIEYHKERFENRSREVRKMESNNKGKVAYIKTEEAYQTALSERDESYQFLNDHNALLS